MILPPSAEISNRDFDLILTVDGHRLGRLKLHRTGVVWYPQDSSDDYEMSWEALTAHIVAGATLD